MHDSTEIDRFVKDPSQLVDLCRDVIEQLDAGDDNASDKEKQLLVIARSIEQLEKARVPVPDALRGEKTRLIAELGVSSESSQTLMQLCGEFEEILKDLKTRLGKNGNSPEVKTPRTKRSRSPKTSQKILREHVLMALKQLGGRARIGEIIDQMGKQLDGKLLPGDMEWREATKEYAWQNNAKWERYQMTQDGALKINSPRGIWELSEDNS